MSSSQARYFVPDWHLPSGLRAACSVRTCGVSTGPWASLNLGTQVGDARDAVAANRAALAADLGLPAEPCWLQQVHGSDVADAAQLRSGGESQRADAIVAQTAEVLAIQVADCLPVLFAARDASVYAAAHAGWRGLAAGVLEQTIARMRAPASQLTAWLGPCIRATAFEVGEEVRKAFGPTFAWAFVANKNGRWQCDLAGIAAARLRAQGVTEIADCGLCTYTDRARFFSHRRDAAILGSSGRMAALLWRAVS